MSKFFTKISQYPVTIVISTLSLLIFGFVNHFNLLPEITLSLLGFSATAPYPEWFYRTLTSDWLYLNPFHFWSCFFSMAILLSWAEHTHSRKFILCFLFFISFFDDFINFFFIIKPLHFINPEIFHAVVKDKDVGGSLIIFCLFGLQLCQLKKYREIIFVAFSFFTVLGIVFSTFHYTSLILNLNHFLFLSVGYIVGKFKFEYDKKTDAREKN